MPVQNVPVRNGLIAWPPVLLLAGFSRTSRHCSSKGRDAKCEADQMNGCPDNQCDLSKMFPDIWPKLRYVKSVEKCVFFFSCLSGVCRLNQTRIFVLRSKSRLPCSMLRAYLIGYQSTLWRIYKLIIIARRYCLLTFLELSVWLMRTVRAVCVPMCHVVFIQPCAIPLGSPCRDP